MIDLRDKFASDAMAATVSGLLSQGLQLGESDAAQVAKASYFMADAMLVERNNHELARHVAKAMPGFEFLVSMHPDSEVRAEWRDWIDKATRLSR